MTIIFSLVFLLSGSIYWPKYKGNATVFEVLPLYFEGNSVIMGINIAGSALSLHRAIGAAASVLDSLYQEACFYMRDYLPDKTSQLKNIQNGMGVQYILDEAYRILGNPLLAHDMEYQLFAYNKDAVNDDPIWNEFTTNGTVGLKRLEFYKNETFFDMVAYAEKVTFLPSERLKYDRIFGKLFTKDQIQVGCVVIHACDKPFENSDIELFSIVCDILNKELSESEYYQNYGQAYMETLVGKLIEDSLDHKLLYTAHIESIFTGLKGNIRLAVADFSRIDPAYKQLVLFRDLFKRTQPSFKYAIYSNHIVILMSSDNETFYINDLHKLYGIFEQHNIYAGISSRLENSFRLSRYYDEAVSALKHGLKTNGSQRIFPYDGGG